MIRILAWLVAFVIFLVIFVVGSKVLDGNARYNATKVEDR